MSLVIANWKMKLNTEQSVSLAREIANGLPKTNHEVVLCPSFTALSEVANIINKKNIKLGAQDCFWEDEGAYTGEVSAKHLKELGCSFVILGHSERRMYNQETDELIHQKAKAALSKMLTPVICVGETFDQRQEGAKDYVLIQQVTKALQGLHVSEKHQIVIAYEPVWVIGSGQAISGEEASAAHQVIHQCLFDLFPAEIVKNCFRIVYGGSVDEENVSAFSGLENTSGVLVGGASLTSKRFCAIINNA
jgi:triosephosphate isomerase